jgi:transposase
LAAEITGGEVSDYNCYDLVMQAEAPAPKVLLADRGYDSDHIRADLKGRGAAPVSPGRRNRKALIPFDDFVHAMRNLVECAINTLKCSRRLATRYDKTAES